MTAFQFQSRESGLSLRGRNSHTSRAPAAFFSRKTARSAVGNDIGPADMVISASNLISTITTEPATTFEPILPDTTALVGFASIVILSGVAGWVWANQVVPVSRTKLALSKKNGPVKEYLDELRASEMAVSTTAGDQGLSNSTTQRDPSTTADLTPQSPSLSSLVDEKEETTTTPSQTVASDRSFERWLFTDWLENNKSLSKGGRQKEPALPILKQAKWNSGDNPILAATALIMSGVVLTAVLEKIGSVLSS